ncbi:hypothetical protein FJY68_13670 [candidate division WOR-3 bacterium]|uniref:Uncharacterized protein n=1 Tax=candidate division WOR-3 bacterium TaxID=2052148 RepID=A0A937XJI8_UNCW3|nr:hypothetical protein [candidate division WOR-3 bacterium]
MPTNTGLPYFSYDTAGAPSVAFHPSGSDQAIMFARRTDSTWAAETIFTAPYFCELVARALTYTVKAEPCVMAYVYYGIPTSTTVILLMEQGDTWPYHVVTGAGTRAHLEALACARDTGGGAAVLYDYGDEFNWTGNLYYAGFGTGFASLDTWASAGAVAVHSSGVPHAAYIRSQLRYACRVGATWYHDTISAASGLQLAGAVLEESLPTIGFIDPATGVWIARRKPVGVQERVLVRSIKSLRPTLVRGMLHLPEAAGLLDITGRKLMDLVPGANDVRALAPGVYFLKEGGERSEEGGAGIRKVVITR